MFKHAMAPLFCAGMLCLATDAMAAGAAPAPPPTAPKPEQVGFCGPVTAVEACVVVNSQTAGTLGDYEISGARPQPKSGDMISGQGTLDGKATCGSKPVTR